MRNHIPNIFGSSVRGTPRPNTCHLPRISYACSFSWKHAVGIPSNANQQTGEIHQKNVTISYYCLKLDPRDNIILPGFNCLVLVMGVFNSDDRTAYYMSSTKQPLMTARRSLRLEKTLFLNKLIKNQKMCRNIKLMIATV